MTILPLVQRELLVRARSPAAYWVRFGAALAGMLICLPAMMLAQGGRAGATMGGYTFQGLVMAAFILSCCTGFLTVDGISRQRREGTLGLLLLTRVKALDVLLGNFGAAGVTCLCALISFLPVLVIPILAGGVTGGEAIRKIIALVDTMLLSLTIGLWASARGSGWLPCTKSALRVWILILLGPPLLEWAWPAGTHWGFSWPGPLGALRNADASTYLRSPTPYWLSIAAVHLASWILAIWAAVRLHRTLREKEEPTDTIANSSQPRRFSRPLKARENPVDWLVRGQPGIKGMIWIAAILAMLYQGFASLGGIFFGAGAWRTYSFWGGSLAISVVKDGLFTWAASRFFMDARRTGELELLLTTPEGARTVISSQLKWLKTVFRLPVCLLLLPTLFSVIYGFLSSTLGSFSRPYSFYFLSSSIVMCLHTLLGTVALIWVAMWFGWSERTQSRAIVRTVVLIVGVPYIITMAGTYVLQQFGPRLIVFHGQFAVWQQVLWSMPQLLQLLFYFYVLRWVGRRFAGALPGQASISFFERIPHFPATLYES